MTNIRRYYQEGNVYFLTHVTHRRAPILVENIDLITAGLVRTRQNSPFDLIAWVVLPDHCHMLIDPKDNDLSLLMRRVKLSFSTMYRKRIGTRSARVWQNRFWDHIIRNQEDMNRHTDYIHYNPVKHGMVTKPAVWEYSSIGDYLKSGYYSEDWGGEKTLVFDGEFGE